MEHHPLDLHIELGQGHDWTGHSPIAHPEIRLAGTEAGLRRLRREITRLIQWSRTDPTYHTHLTGRDPGIHASPPSLTVTLSRLLEARTPPSPGPSQA